MSKPRKIQDFFKKPQATPSTVSTPFTTSTPSTTPTPSSNPSSTQSSRPRLEAEDDGTPKRQRVEGSFVDTSTLQRDPGLRPPIWEYPVKYHDEIRRFYISSGAYQVSLEDYPFNEDKHHRRFKESWYAQYSWLEYSPTTNKAYCLPCYVFAKKGGPSSSKTFTFDGFCAWKKGGEKESAFLSHIGKGPCSVHQNAVKYCESLMKPATQIDAVLNRQSSEQIAKNRLRLRTSIDAVKYLVFQGCAFRGHDESHESLNRGNFLEMVRLLSEYNEKVAEVVLENAPKNATYTSPTIQKEILSIWSKRVRSKIREDIGDSKFCIIVDEARDESKREQMGLVIRFVDREGFIRERFFDLVHVKDTAALTLKEALCDILSRSCLSIQNIRGQGYDGASNMRGEWNGLQALFLKDCPSAYYVHCMAHRLQLALVTASKEVSVVYEFFDNLNYIINIVGASCKRNDELREAQANEFSYLTEINELESGRGLNQIGTLQRAGDTRWSSHYNSMCSLLRMFGPVKLVLVNLGTQKSTVSVRGDAAAALRKLMSFEFVFILHIMMNIMGITDLLCQCLQKETQNMVNAIDGVNTTKGALQKLRESGWESLIEDIKSFCEKHGVKIPNLSKRYSKGIGRPRLEDITCEHYYRFDIFTAVVDSQMSELRNRFSDSALELYTLLTCLDPKNHYASFDKDKIMTLADKYYPSDFTESEKCQLKNELLHFEVDISCSDMLKDLSTISELCRVMVVTRKAEFYPMIHRLICLVMTLPVSTATTERAFSAMKIVKTTLRNKMEDDFLADCLLLYIEKEIAQTFSTEMLIDDFSVMKHRRVQLVDK